jgi:hypothetical protein
LDRGSFKVLLLINLAKCILDGNKEKTVTKKPEKK